MIPSPIKSKSVYKWNVRPGFNFQGDVQVIGERLETIIQQNGGALLPSMVVEDASDASSPFHPNFEWDDAKAARRDREHTARNLIGSIVLVRHEETDVPGTIRAFVNVRQGGESFYTTMIYAMGDDDLTKQVLEKAWREILAWRKQYQDLSALSHVFRVIDDFVFQKLPEAA